MYHYLREWVTFLAELNWRMWQDLVEREQPRLSRSSAKKRRDDPQRRIIQVAKARSF